MPSPQRFTLIDGLRVIAAFLTRRQNSPTILFLGTISYSLYLVHLPNNWRLIAQENKPNDDDMSLLTASPVLISGLAISIVTAWLLYRTVEKPTSKFSTE